MVCSHSLVLKYVWHAPDVDNYSPKFVWQNPLLLSFDAMQFELDTFCFHCKLCGTLAWVRKNKDLLFVFSSLILFGFWDFNRLFAWMEAGILCLFLAYGFTNHSCEKTLMQNAPVSFCVNRLLASAFLISSHLSLPLFFGFFFFTPFRTAGSLLVNGPQFTFVLIYNLKEKPEDIYLKTGSW